MLQNCSFCLELYKLLKVKLKMYFKSDIQNKIIRQKKFSQTINSELLNLLNCGKSNEVIKITQHLNLNSILNLYLLRK